MGLNKMPGGGLTAPKKLSPELADIVGKKTASRAELMKLLWAYIKKNNLQDPDNKQYFVPDKKMAKVLDLRRSEASAWPRASDPISLKESAPHFYTSTKINKKMNENKQVPCIAS